MIIKQSIHIAVASNNGYAVLIAALFKSVIVNHKTSENLVFYILDDQISSINKSKINNLTNQHDNVEINWINVNEVLPAGMKFPIDNTAFPFTAFFRLFAPYVLSDHVTKLIYFDVDMIVRKDVSDLWNFDLENYTVAAVTDVCETVGCEWGGIPNYKQLGIPSGAKYFNSGLLLINPKLWRENNIPQKVFNAINDNSKYVNFPDQYGLNVVFAQNWKEINPLWNWYANNPHPDPYNIHFLDIKPVYKSYRSDEDFKKEFFKYLDMTPFKGIKLRSDYERLLRKGFTKIKKKLLKLIS